jgi:hypothetical protein
LSFEQLRRIHMLFGVVDRDHHAPRIHIPMARCAFAGAPPGLLRADDSCPGVLFVPVFAVALFWSAALQLSAES